MDIIPTSPLIECHHSFSEIIAHLANMSFTDGKFPSRSKLRLSLRFLKVLLWTNLLIDLFQI